ncbi:MAG: hypothetical protein GF399_12865 [Candidatus Coatesbacteria bacterium]|nr:hypothetical protein [Candidatus Coatesbacteria bacterium]
MAEIREDKSTSSENCRYFIAALLRRGYTIRKIAKLSDLKLSKIRTIWQTNTYNPTAHELNLEFNTLAERNDDLPRYVELLEEGKRIAEEMPEDTWLTFRNREQWIKEHS